MSKLNLEQQRKRAKDLHRAHSQGAPEAALRIAQYLPRLRGLAPSEVFASDFALSEAQFVVAQEAGFASWPKLKHALEPGHDAFNGSWTVDVVESRRHPLNLFRGATVRIEVSGDIVTIEHSVIDDAGREERATSVLQVDGKEHGAGESAHLGIATWVDKRRLEVVDKFRGEVVGRGVYEISPDGETLTIQTSEQNLVLTKEG
jgi:hypothetical protein